MKNTTLVMGIVAVLATLSGCGIGDAGGIGVGGGVGRRGFRRRDRRLLGRFL